MPLGVDFRLFHWVREVDLRGRKNSPITDTSRPAAKYQRIRRKKGRSGCDADEWMMLEEKLRGSLIGTDV